MNFQSSCISFHESVFFSTLLRLSMAIDGSSIDVIRAKPQTAAARTSLSCTLQENEFPVQIIISSQRNSRNVICNESEKRLWCYGPKNLLYRSSIVEMLLFPRVRCCCIRELAGLTCVILASSFEQLQFHLAMSSAVIVKSISFGDETCSAG